MSVFMISDNNPVDPSNLIPFLEKDPAIQRALTKGMVDFSNPASWDGTVGAMVAGSKAHDLVNGGGDAVAVHSFPAVTSGGLVVFDGAAPAARQLQLPANFRLATGMRKVLTICYVKLLKTGWGTPAANSFPMLFGCMDVTSGGVYQYGLYLQVSTTGVVNYLSAAGVGIQAQVLAGAVLDGILDGNLHQLATYWEVNDAGTQHRLTLFKDRAQVAQNGFVAWAGGAMPQPVAAPGLGYGSTVPYQAPWNNTAIGRPSVLDLTGSTKTVDEILAADAAAAAGYLF